MEQTFSIKRTLYLLGGLVAIILGILFLATYLLILYEYIFKNPSDASGLVLGMPLLLIGISFTNTGIAAIKHTKTMNLK